MYILCFTNIPCVTTTDQKVVGAEKPHIKTAYCTETLNDLKYWNTWKLKILWLQIDLTNLDQLEFEVTATILGEFWQQSWI